MISYGRTKRSPQKQKIIFGLNFFQMSQMSMLLAVVVTSMIGNFLIGSISQTPLQQYVFAQQRINTSTYDRTIISTPIPQIHNFTSSGPGPVNSWILESTNGVVIVDTQRTLSEAEKPLR